MIDISELKDWCIGALRIQLGLDEYCHGIKTWDPVKNPEQLAQRLKNAEQVPLLKFLYGKVIEEGGDNSGPQGVEEFLKEIEPHGTQVEFLKPFGKLNALFIDDEDPPDGTWRVLFNIRKLIYSPEKLGIAKTDWLILQLENLKRDRYMIDFILLDLCIGDDLNNDPTGYGFLPVLRQFFPLTPIIVFSTFGDMGHISRAFREGATWYLSKADKEKLPRHLMAIYSYPKWEREWEAVRKAYTFCPNCSNEEKGQKPNLQEIQKFLIVSTLKSLPGYRIEYLNPNEGASSATTFIVEKEHSKGVVKIDIPVNTKSEYARYQRFIRPYLDNHAGRIYNAPIIADFQTSAIAYTFAGGPSGEIKTFRKRITDFLISHDETSCKTICKIIDDLYNLIARLHEIDIKSNAKDHPDYPNLFYFETPSPSAAYVMKMPNDYKIIAEAISTDIDGNDGYFISRGIKKGKKNVHFFADQDLTPWNVSGDVIESAGMYDLNSFVFRVPGSAAESKNAELGDELRKAFDEEVKKNNITPTIIHGDLNTGNIMLEENNRIWLIDFARTRRDLIAHDFNVLFTSILPLLCQKELLKDEGYRIKLDGIYDAFLENVLFNEHDAIPDIIENDRHDVSELFVGKHVGVRDEVSLHVKRLRIPFIGIIEDVEIG